MNSRIEAVRETVEMGHSAERAGSWRRCYFQKNRDHRPPIGQVRWTWIRTYHRGIRSSGRAVFTLLIANNCVVCLLPRG